MIPHPKTSPATPGGYRVLLRWMLAHDELARVGVAGAGAETAGGRSSAAERLRLQGLRRVRRRRRRLEQVETLKQVEIGHRDGLRRF